MSIAPFLFILVGILCEFAMLPGVYILLTPQEEEVNSSTWGHRSTHSEIHSWKKFKLFLPLFYYAKVIVELEKHKQGIKELNCAMLMVLVIWWSSTSKFQFVFGFKECLSNLFLNNFWKIFGFILELGLYDMTFDFLTQMTWSHLLPLMPMNKKL